MEVAIETKMNNGYFAVALDKESCNVAKRNAQYDVVVGAHITISHRKGFKSGDANSMFKRPAFKEERLGMLEGRVKWIPFKEKI